MFKKIIKKDNIFSKAETVKKIIDNQFDTDKSKAIELQKKGEQFLAKKDYDKASENLNETLKLLLKYKKNDWEVIKNQISQIYKDLGVLEWDRKNYEEAINKYQEALKILNEYPNDQKNYLKIADLYLVLSVTYNLVENYDEAIKQAELGIWIQDYLESQQKHELQKQKVFLDIHLELGYSYFKKAEYYISELHYKKALTQLEEIPFDKQKKYMEKKISLIQKNLSQVHLKFRGEMEKYQKYFAKTLQIFKKISHESTKNLTMYNSFYDVKMALDNLLNEKQEISGQDSDKVAEIYEVIGKIFMDQDKKTKYAIKNFIKALAIRKKSKKPFSEGNLARCYSYLANAYYDDQSYFLASNTYSEALKLRIQLYGEKNIFVADTCNNYGQNQFQLQNYKESYEFLTSALNIYSFIYSDLDEKVVKIHRNIVKIFFQQEDSKKAWDYYLKYLDLQRKNSGVIYNQSKDIYFSKYLNPEKIKYEKESTTSKYLQFVSALKALIKKQKNKSGDKSIEVAEMIYDLAKVHLIFGSYQFAQDHFEKSIKIFLRLQNNEKDKEKLGGLYVKLYRAYYNIGYLNFQNNNYQQSVEFYKKAKDYIYYLQDFNEELFSSFENENMIEFNNNFAIVNYKIGKFDEGYDYLQKVCLQQKPKLPEKMDKPIKKHRQPKLEDLEGDIDFSVFGYQKEKLEQEEYEKSLKPVIETDPNLGYTYHLLGNGLFQANDINKSIEFFEQAHAVRLRQQGRGQEELMKTKFMLGVLYEQKKQNQIAFQHFDEALKIALAIYKKDNEIIASCQAAVGRVSLILQKNLLASKSIQDSLEIRGNLFGKDHPLTVQSQQLFNKIKHSKADT